MLCWPDEREAAEHLADLGLPRLLLVGSSAPPLESPDERDEWVRLPVSDEDVQTRLRCLRERCERHPWLDGCGRLLLRGEWVPLSFTEERLASALVRNFGRVVPTAALIAAGWPGRRPSANGYRVMIVRLRQRCRLLGLEITTVRERGYVLHAAASVPETPVDAGSARIVAG